MKKKLLYILLFAIMMNVLPPSAAAEEIYNEADSSLSITESEDIYNGVESIQFEKKSISLKLKEISFLSYSYTYYSETAREYKTTWSSSNKKVATISKEGLITAVSPGKTIITIKKGTVKDTCEVTVKLTETQKKVNKKIKSVIKNKITKNMSTVKKVKAIHDYIVSTTAYDYKNYLAGTIPNSSYEASGVVLKNIAVCSGYAEAFKLFMDELNIPCKVVTGTAGGGSHAWNMVKIGGSWYWVDVTWDDPVPNTKKIRYNYFLISNTELKKDHNWDKSEYSAKGTKYKYYGYKK